MNNKITRYKVSYRGLDANKLIDNCDLQTRTPHITNSWFVNVKDLLMSNQDMLSKLTKQKHNKFVNIRKIDYENDVNKNIWQNTQLDVNIYMYFSM